VEFIKFIGILTIMTYVKCTNIRDYWSIKQETARVSLVFGQYMVYQRFRNIIKYLKLMDARKNDDPFHFAQQFHDVFNENLTKAILPDPYFCMDESMSFADAQINLFLRLDPAEPSEYAIKKKFSDQYPATVASMLRLVEPWFHNYTYRSSVSRTCKINNVDLAICSICDRKDIVLLSSYSTTTLGTEVNQYIKGSGDVKFCRPVVFNEYNEFRLAVNILNNLCDNALLYHNVLVSKYSVDHIFAFYRSVVEANSFSAYYRFVLGKKDMKHVDFLTSQSRNSKANMFNADAKVVVNVLIPVVAVQFHKECV
ncbi:3728_t:CDS:2, partial [Diversispora eburnea]